MSFCMDCAPASNHPLEDIIQAAKKYAVENQTTMAVFKEGNAYGYTTATDAIARGLVVVTFVSQFS